MKRAVAFLAVLLFIVGCGSTRPQRGRSPESEDQRPRFHSEPSPWIHCTHRYRDPICEWRRHRHGRIEIMPARIEGGCPVAGVTNSLARRGDAIRACYDERLDHYPLLEGRLHLMWTIDPSGKVLDASTAWIGELRDVELSKCLLGRLEMVRFASPGPQACYAAIEIAFHRWPPMPRVIDDYRVYLGPN